MTLFQRYLFRQIALPVVAACPALAGIGLLSQSLDQLEIIVERGQSVWVMVKLTLLAMPQLIAVILPVGLFVGALVSLTRLQREQELTAAFASGMSRRALIDPAVRVALLVAALALVINLFVQPWAQREARTQAFAIRTDLAALLVEEGRFVQGPNGLTIYVQQIEQNGLLKNMFVYLNDKGKVTTWNAAEARFGRVNGQPVLTMFDGSWQQYSSQGVLDHLSFDRWPFELAPYAQAAQTVRYKPSDLYMNELFAPSPGPVADAGSRGELLAEAHARFSSPLYALVAMAIALAAIMGGAFSRTGYGSRIAKAAAAFLVVRIMGYGLVAASAWNGWLNVLQYIVPILAMVGAMYVIFKTMKPNRQRRSGPLDRLKARTA